MGVCVFGGGAAEDRADTSKSEKLCQAESAGHYELAEQGETERYVQDHLGFGPPPSTPR